MSEKFTFFWSGPFSQWHMCKFTEDTSNDLFLYNDKIFPDVIEYNCAEQYMMFYKALLFQDTATARRILESTDPREQKALGRQINNFDELVWNDNCETIVYSGNHLKFTQNDNLLKVLAKTKGTTLVEASPYDKIWGIGLRKDDPRALDRNQWLGKNKLGNILTRLREDICY